VPFLEVTLNETVVLTGMSSHSGVAIMARKSVPRIRRRHPNSLEKPKWSSVVIDETHG
jgi:hypothetical protein